MKVDFYKLSNKYTVYNNLIRIETKKEQDIIFVLNSTFNFHSKLLFHLNSIRQSSSLNRYQPPIIRGSYKTNDENDHKTYEVVYPEETFQIKQQIDIN